MIQKLLTITILSLLIVSCGGEKKGTFDVMSTKNCTQEGRNQFVYDVLKDSYLWSDEVSDINRSMLSLDDRTFLNQYLYNVKDVYSFIITKEQYNQHFVSGESKDFGYRSVNYRDEYNVTREIVKFVFPNSAADKAGIKRSDIILPRDANDTQLHIQDQNGLIRDISLKSERYDVHNVLYQKIFDLNRHKVGYFLFKSFVGPNLIKNLNETFATFKREGIDELIIDLRYNGGGLLHVAAHLGSLIGGENVKGHIFQYNRYNQKYSKYNDKTYFAPIPIESLHLKKVYFLTTGDTVSASESLINALKASENGIEVITIGMETEGKQFGMHTMHYCDKVLVPIQFSDSNSDGEGFIGGLKPTCKLQENFAHDFADINEDLLSEALYHIENGQCKR